MERFFENSGTIRYAYFFNRTAARKLNERWDLKEVPEYTMICQDENDKDDYRREYREDLATRGISFIYPKWILELESKRINMLDFLIKESRNNLYIADAIGPVDKTMLTLKIFERAKIPVFGTYGKNNILLRTYANCRDFFDRQKFLCLMDRVYHNMDPSSRGRFFQDYIRRKDRKHLDVAITKYNVPGHLSQRESLNRHIIWKKMFSPFLISMGGKLW
jgi:hypothetical protein